MSIGEIINSYARQQSPYMGQIVNHLPMGQFALYRLGQELDEIENYSLAYNRKFNINGIDEKDMQVESLEYCLGKRRLYEPCLNLIKEKIEEQDLGQVVREVLNKFKLGISSDLFHTSIRLAYAIEGHREDIKLEEEVARALAYYVTAYRKADIFQRKINPSQIREQMGKLAADRRISKLLKDKESLGQRLSVLYKDEDYIESAFVLQGREEEKISSLLSMLIPLYYNSRNIVVLHSITGLHAILILREYFDDYDQALDILTTSIISHLLTIDNLKYEEEIPSYSELSWECIKEKALNASDVHAIKLSYSACFLDKTYGIKGLKDVALARLR